MPPAFHSPNEPTPRPPDSSADPFPEEWPLEEPTRPSTPSSLHPYRSAGSAPSIPPVVLPPRYPSVPTPALESYLRELRKASGSRPSPPLIDPWWRALLRFLGF